MIAHELRRGNVTFGEEQLFCVLPSKKIQTAFCSSVDLSCSDCDVADALYSLFLTEKHLFLVPSSVLDASAVPAA